jgi:uncharacterized phage protein gp47/JayE
MPLTLKDFLTPRTEDQLLDEFLGLLVVAGFPVTSWQVGGVARTLARLVARGVVKLHSIVAAIAAGGFNSHASLEWLTLLSREVYENERRAATFAQGQVQLGLVNALAGPYTITVGQLWFVWGQRRYRNTSGGTLTWPDTLILPFKAESPGAAYNAPDNTLSLQTPLAGMLVLASEVTTQGADAEKDLELRARNRGKWGTVGPAANDDGWETYARNASPEVKRVLVLEDTPSDGEVRVVVAGSAGALSAPTLAAINTYLDGRRPLCVGVEAVNAGEQPLAVTGTVRILASDPNAGAALAQAQEELLALFAVLSIGGVVRLGDLYEAIESTAGVSSSLLSAPLGDVQVAATSVAVPTITLTPEYV